MPAKNRAVACLLTFFVLLAGGGVSLGQEALQEPDTEQEKLDARVNRFLDGVSAEDAQAAYEDLLAGSQLLRQKALTGLVEKTTELKKYGKCHEFEQIGVKPVGKDLVLMKYLYKCEDFPVIWYFSFYRTPSGTTATADNGVWRIVSVRFDTRLELLWLTR